MSLLTKETIDFTCIKDEAAFEHVFRIYYPRLVYFANEYVPYEIARGLVQDSFVVLWEKNPSFSNEHQLRSYLYTLVKNNCLMELRHEKVKMNHLNNIEQSHIENKIYLLSLEKLNTSEATFNELESIIEKTLESLPPRCREVFALSRYKGKKNREIAEELGISVKGVEAQVTEALKMFRVALKDYLPVLASILMFF